MNPPHMEHVPAAEPRNEGPSRILWSRRLNSFLPGAGRLNRASILRPPSTPFGALRAQWAQLNTPSRARRTVRGAATGHPVPDASGTLNLTGKPAFIEEFGGPARRRPGAIRVLQDASKGGSTARATAKRALNGGTRSPPQLGSHPSKGLLWSRPGASGGARPRACSA